MATKQNSAGVLSNSYKNSIEPHSVEKTITNFHTYLLMNACNKAVLPAFRPKTI